MTEVALPTPYQQFIHLSRYSRWRDDLGRRETWEETVDRYLHFFDEYTGFRFGDVLHGKVRDFILNLKAMPSMRALMTAGEALKREPLSGYNCSYLAVNNKRAFSEAMYILMSGTGVGFSCERQEIANLPTIPKELNLVEDTIVVADSKEGWANAYRKYISALYNGEIPQIDFSKVRPAGARLKTFGGRASGPESLKRLFDFTERVFNHAAGRKLNSIEVHDLMCMIGEVVVVGGVRRSALISLSNLSDQRMRDAKSGQWWEANPQRALANNSVAYTEKPEVEIFMEEWLALIKSKSGERGIFNRAAAQKQASKWGRRSADHTYGVNPCLSGDTLLLTDFGLRPMHELAEYEEPVYILNGEGKWAETTVVSTGVKPLFKVTLSNGLSFRATEDHLVEVCVKKYDSQDSYVSSKTVMVKDLAVGDKMRPFVAGVEWAGIEPFANLATATLAGLLQGDGYHCQGRVAITTNEKEVIDFLKSFFPDLRVSEKGVIRLPKGVLEDLGSRGVVFTTLPERRLPAEIFGWSSTTVKAFLKGLYSANGSLLSGHNRVTLKTTCKPLAEDLQKLLLALGFNAYITTNLPSESQWENGTYTSRMSYDVNIAGSEECTKFQKEIGFLHEHKMQQLEVKPKRNQSRVVSIISITEQEPEEVYDFVEPRTSWAWVNGLKIHNCSEIILRDKQLCNLSEVVVRADDTLETLKEKVEVATILGTMQSMLTDFGFLSGEWSKNTKEERLLGVSLTGIFDNRTMSGLEGEAKLVSWLNQLRDHARAVNLEWAEKLDIEPSTAISAVKPSGTVSQLVNSSSGIHHRHARQYMRTVRIDKKDPLYRLMMDKGVYMEDDYMRPQSTAVIYFPQYAPEGCLDRHSMTAIEHLNLWLIYQREWCEHKPSVTISVREDEWVDVGAWVYRHFDEVSGISFLPMSEHTYKQAPYQDMSFEKLQEWEKEHPWPNLDWNQLSDYEKEDNTIGVQTLACTGGVCEL